MRNFRGKVLIFLQLSNFNTHIFLSQYYEIPKGMLIEVSNDSGILRLRIEHVQLTRTFQFSDDLAPNI